MNRTCKNDLAIRREHNGWKNRMMAALFLVGTFCSAAFAQSLEIYDTNSAGYVSQVSVAALSGNNEFVTAVENAGNELEVIVWQDVTNQRTINRVNSLDVGPLGGMVTVAGIANNRFVTAIVNSEGYLELIVFQLNADGSISRLGSARTTNLTFYLALTALDSQRVVTVASEEYSEASVTTWIVDASGNISPLGNGATLENQSSSLAVAAMSTSQIAVVQNNGPVPLIITTYGVDSSGNLTYQYTAEAFGFNPTCLDPCGQAPVAAASVGGGNLVIESEMAGGTPDITAWAISPSGIVTEIYEPSDWLSLGPATTAAVANMNGMAFTIDNSAGGLTTYEAEAWQINSVPNFQQLAAQTVTGCTGNCNSQYVGVAAAGMPGGLVATATMGANQDLIVSVWLFL